MKFLKSHFALSRSQQNGIFLLVLLIIIFQVAIFSYDHFIPNPPGAETDPEVEAMLKSLDSIRSSEDTRKDTVYPFNPNFITDFKGYQLGLKVEEIDRLLAYRAEGKWVNSKEDFQKVTGVSDSLLNVIAPSFRFPEWTQNVRQQNIATRAEVTAIPVADLNAATAEDLVIVRGVGEVLSQRIVKYRKSIGGFLDVSQLKDVYGLSDETIGNIQKHFGIISKPDVSLKNINTIRENELAELPYFNETLARKVINFRNLHEGIRSFEELAQIDGFPSDKIDRIKLYLGLN
ncbi:helix-hairpin-helix domain-containing protein [Gramella sp. GC03-9]|uniref:Helix-hairpin-helix domain-containing protein n=1 Tax=Christiangramia oceanisediminis TaxID=2920386 RepID=A0A9X2KZJ4_9FLAO|nr:helix-hairpin-helix domain-containing protein [Gramella oceanisediminis]MCP9201180.1 helix-hairpin-helix domain-containing protein [Gramella oceanisediminis]